ncbi:MAG TPA: hypothetical protein VK557_13040 [Pyrinomonadaceae bacterium]|nr:hypothetical protein [Pyrinomonadaceae bacterium]
MLNPKTRTFEITQRYATQNSQASRNPVEYQTENGFAIIRLGDVDASVSLKGTRHYFIVRDPYGYELDITVEISNEAVADVMWRCRGRITLESSFWIACAEGHLATYLWENEDYPPDGKLTVDQLSLDDLDLARRWNCDEE